MGTFDPVRIFCNSFAALTYAKDRKYNRRTKHIDIQYHYIKDMVVDKELVLKCYSTSHMVIDLLTKFIAKETFMDNVRSLRIA